MHAVDIEERRVGKHRSRGSEFCMSRLSKRCGSMDVDGLHHWYPAIEFDGLSCPRSLPNRYDQRGAGAVIKLSLE